VSDPTNFYAHLISMLYTTTYADGIYLCGDCNERTGDCKDFIESIDHLPCRINVDKERNTYGETLCDFLIDTQMCIANGRICQKSNNYTCISSRGLSVVDYLLVPQLCMNKVNDLRVITT